MNSSVYDVGPRGVGLSMVIDRLGPIDIGVLGAFREYINVVKIGWTLPLVADRKFMGARVSAMTGAGLRPGMGGTALEILAQKGRLDAGFEVVLQLGFRAVEISSGITEMSSYDRKRIAEFARSNGLYLSVEVGKKREREQLSLNETLEALNRAADLEPDMVVLEGRETGLGVGIFDERGNIKWDWVDAIEEGSGKCPLMYEAPQERQQVELISRLGPGVNLGNIAPASLPAMVTQRLGMRGDTYRLDISSARVRGSPADKFVYYVVCTLPSPDQAAIVSATGLGRRTVQKSLRALIADGLITEHRVSDDMRKRVYRPKGA